ncbi:MAG: hypothetical protein L0Y72_21610 [Gemmataceae bacterium]|nr:hypothetical protein [Gemmataceae bacterium]MCI0741640.1 hypothetical protein [Gemmataceae bacterium]
MPQQPEHGIQPAGNPLPSSPSGDTSPTRERGDIQDSSPQDAEVIPLPPPATAPVPKPPAWLDRCDVMLVFLLLVLTFLVGSFAATNSDIWMQLATGRLIAEGDWTVGHDPFSVATEATGSRPAVPWINHSWLWTLILYTLYGWFGGAGLIVFKAFLGVILVALLLSIRDAQTKRWLSVACVCLAALAVSNRLLMQPMVASYLLLGLSLWVFHRSGALSHSANMAGNPRLLWLMPLVCLVWANLDVFFILGPLCLALLWASTGVAKLFGKSNAVPGRTLGLVFITSVAACLVNPHTYHVFQLPGELAYLIVRVVDLPDFLTAGGRTFQNIQRHDPSIFTLQSPFDRTFWLTGVGLNVAGLSFWLLLLVCLGSFVVGFLTAGWAGARGLQPGRCALCLLFVLFALMQHRLIPLFAIVAGPIAVLNWGDWLAWRESQIPTAMPRSWQAAGLARIGTVGAFLILFYLVWPGWLNWPPGDYRSPRRVDWSIHSDASLASAAQKLGELHKAGPAQRVFNFTGDLANYCAWHAPGVKCYFDFRWSLFPSESGISAKTKKALLDDTRDELSGKSGGAASDIWHKTFADRKINLVAVTNIDQVRERRSRDFVLQAWLYPKKWEVRYGDGRTVLLAWGEGQPVEGYRWDEDLLAQAFGAQAEQTKPPEDGTPLLSGPLGDWDLYRHGVKPRPLEAHRANLLMTYSQVRSVQWQDPFVNMAQVVRWIEPASTCGVVAGSVTGPATLSVMLNIPIRLYSQQNMSGRSFLRAKYGSPPAAPVLMVRHARRAIADNPQDGPSYKVLAEAYQRLFHQQEEHWGNYGGDAPSGFRQTIRQIQIVTALRNYLLLQPDDYDVQELIAELYLEQHYLDVALEHMRNAVKYMNEIRVVDPTDLEALKDRKRKLNDKLKLLDMEVRKRRGDFDLTAATRKGLDKYRLAVRIPFRTIDINNKESVDPRGMGLALEALNQLQNEKLIESLNPQDQLEAFYWQVRLLLMMGRGAEIDAFWPEIEKALGPLFFEARAMHAAAMGDYAGFDKAMAEVEKRIDLEKAGSQIAQVLADSLLLKASFGFPLVARIAVTVRSDSVFQNLAASQENTVRQAAEWRLLRGLLALEAGDITHAKRLCSESIRLSEPEVHFPDRAIAERYLELIARQEK